MSLKLVWVAVLAAAGLSVGVAALPASAGTTPTPHPTISSPGHAHVPWVSADCASGAIGTATVTVDWNITVPATATACGTQDPAAAFELVAFRTDWDEAVAGAGSLVKYKGDDPTTAQIGFHATWVPASRLFGVCLMGRLDQRFDCVKIDFEGGVLTQTDIPIDDPLVTKPMVYNDDPVMTHPGSTWCVNCVATPW